MITNKVIHCFQIRYPIISLIYYDSPKKVPTVCFLVEDVLTNLCSQYINDNTLNAYLKLRYSGIIVFNYVERNDYIGQASMMFNFQPKMSMENNSTTKDKDVPITVFVTYSVVMPILCIIGIIGNSLSIVILSRKTLKKSIIYAYLKGM